MWETMPSYLEVAQEAARWIRSTAKQAEHGLVWLPDPDQPERLATITPPGTIYSGNGGIVLFLIEMARATGDASYLDDARRGADQIAATWRDDLDFPALIDLDNVNLAFNMGSPVPPSSSPMSGRQLVRRDTVKPPSTSRITLSMPRGRLATASSGSARHQPGWAMARSCSTCSGRQTRSMIRRCATSRHALARGLSRSPSEIREVG